MESPITYRGTVYPWHCDHVGHMNGRFRHEMSNDETGEVASKTTLKAVHLDAELR